jgi:hypothetical protein
MYCHTSLSELLKQNSNTKLATCRGRGIKPCHLLSYPVLQSCSSWGDPKTALCASFREILKSVKSVIKNSAFEELFTLFYNYFIFEPR